MAARTTRRTPRFAQDRQESGSNDILSGYQRETADRFDRGFIKRNIATYKKAGFPQDLRKLAGMNDDQLYNAAARAVIKKAGLPKKPAKTTKRAKRKA